MSKLRKFRELQAIYTPAATSAMQADEAARDPDLPPPNLEDIPLWLPSDLPAAMREGNGCQRNIVEMELAMREGQCRNALTAIRMLLHSKRFLIMFRDDNITGQKKATRAHTIIELLDDRVETVARKYWKGHAALTSLKGADYMPELQLLKASDLILQSVEARDPGKAAKSDREAQKKLGRIGSGLASRALRSDASSSTPAGVPWIWMAEGSLDDSEKDLHELLRVEWARAKARKSRWDEEVELLREEMRRVIRYLAWQVAYWEQLRATTAARVDIGAATRHGMEAYAAKQAALYRQLSDHFRDGLSLPVDVATATITALEDEEGPVLRSIFTEVVALGIIMRASGQATATDVQRPRERILQKYIWVTSTKVMFLRPSLSATAGREEGHHTKGGETVHWSAAVKSSVNTERRSLLNN
ncbi:hypothetical protein FB451DRAFT_1510779 [Mycena latifolia]|nr:hypothetical protein FB451DRAFT_1510779 [Mycena latifolia]